MEKTMFQTTNQSIIVISSVTFRQGRPLTHSHSHNFSPVDTTHHQQLHWRKVQEFFASFWQKDDLQLYQLQ